MSGNLRIEEAKRLLESDGSASSEEIASAVGYENPAFFRRLFKRHTGLTTAQYRRMFRPIAQAGFATGRDHADTVPAEPQASSQFA